MHGPTDDGDGLEEFDRVSERVLIVEDDPDIVALLDGYLRREGYKVSVAVDGVSGLQRGLNDAPAVVILDLMLPKVDGLEVCRRLRETSAVPILMLTAKSQEPDKLLGLEAGADDYVTKPFSPRELVARVKALLRRSSVARDSVAPPLLVHQQLRLDPDRRVAQYADRHLDLTATEFDLLQALLRRPGRVFTRSQLLEQMERHLSTEHTIEVHVANLRRKLKSSTVPDLIETVRGVGYRLKE